MRTEFCYEANGKLGGNRIVKITGWLKAGRFGRSWNLCTSI